MTSIEITRHAAADPASVALLLASPAAEAANSPAAAEASGEVSLVRRNGVGFAAGVDLVDRDGNEAFGVLTVVPSTDAGCEVRIELSPVDAPLATGAEAWAASFLDSLAERARLRSAAA
jgi:hypothetical protein